MTISAKLVKELRDRTGAGILDCKKALEANEGNVDKSIDWLREKGIASAQKKSGRIAAEGTTNVLVDGNNAIILEMNSETDFVAKNTQFVELVDNVSRVILDAKSASVEEALELDLNGEKVNDAIIAATATIGEKITLRRFVILTKEDAQEFGSYIHMGGKISALTVVEIVKNDPELAEKPEKVVEGIIKGRVSKSLQDISLVDQIYFKDGKAKVAAFLKSENAEVKTFVRYALGEGIEKKVEDFAEEVAKASQV